MMEFIRPLAYAIGAIGFVAFAIAIHEAWQEVARFMNEVDWSEGDDHHQFH